MLSLGRYCLTITAVSVSHIPVFLQYVPLARTQLQNIIFRQYLDYTVRQHYLSPRGKMSELMTVS